MKFIRKYLLYLAISTSGVVNAQSLYDCDDNRLASKLNQNSFEVTGSTFIVKDGRLIETLNGQLREDLGVNYYVRGDNRVNYYNSQDQYVGYYIPSEGRYYRINPGKSVEDDHMALLYNGEIYTVDDKPRYKIDSGFDPEFIGFVLFFFFC